MSHDHCYFRYGRETCRLLRLLDRVAAAAGSGPQNQLNMADAGRGRDVADRRQQQQDHLLPPYHFRLYRVDHHAAEVYRQHVRPLRRRRVGRASEVAINNDGRDGAHQDDVTLAPLRESSIFSPGSLASLVHFSVTT